MSIYEFLRGNVDPETRRLSVAADELPDEEPNDGRIRWAAGALDGVMGHHGGPADEQLRVKQIVAAIEALSKNASAAGLRQFYQLVTRESVLGIIDAVLGGVRESPRIHADRLYAIGAALAREAPKREAVKLGIALLGIVRGADDRELLMTLGLHDELTLFVAAALCNQDDDVELALFELAKGVEGWGRIHVVERLADAQQPEVRAWLIREGFRNRIMNEYLAYTCAMAGHLHTALAAKDPDDDLLRGAGDVFVALASGGPAQDLADYAHAAEAIDSWLSHVERRPVDLRRLEVFDALARRDEVSAALKARMQQLTKSTDVVALIETGLASMDDATFGLADQLARRHGMATFDKHETRLEKGIGEPAYAMFRLMEEATDATIDRALAAASSRIDLAAVATGPIDSLGLGPGFRAHNLLDSVLVRLGPFEGRGVPFVVAGLRSPVVRNRNGALRVLATWDRAHWPDDVAAAVKSAGKVEPDASLKAAFERVLAGGSVDEP